MKPLELCNLPEKLNRVGTYINSIPGVEGHNSAKKDIIGPGDQYYEKYKKLFKGVKL